ncbi:hypothetical protein JCGZ_17504 [Jatropha curcas]|uniref:Cytochrome P450 n=1 Tax=Jatropha curcas TaxID=180498 RepID=A0A067JQW3_JATCU|nr:cytochrome P450 CYP82D47 [Jatropha curcas]KDP26346.1 hypothetical protein JCGZ_17504 [Jatropha curcas]
MDFPSHIVAIAGVISLVLLYNLWRFGKNGTKNKGLSVPEAPGALPIIGHLHRLGGEKTLARTMGDLADKCGPIFTVRLGAHKAIIISNYEAMKETFTTNDILFSSRPPSSQAKYIGYNYAAFGFAPYGTYWRNMRKLIMIELLSVQRIKLMRHVQVSEVNNMIKDLYSDSKKKIDMSEMLEHLILNIITRMVAGKRYFDGNSEGRDEHGRPIGKIMREFMFVVGALVPGDLIPFLGWWDIQGIKKTMKKVSKELDVIMSTWIEEHKTKKNKTDSNKDFIDVMLSVIEDDTTFGHKCDVIIKSTAMSLIVAGSDTTSITMTWALSSLLNNRKTLERLQEELDQKVGRDRWVDDSDIEKLDYFSAVIKETLRLYPPGPLGVPREATEDCTIAGYHIPKGTRLFTNLWKLHRDPNVWADPEEFKPERFLTDNANLDVSGQHFEYLPFGAGRRSCPGLNFAMQVMNITLARLLQAYDFRTPGNEPVDMTEGKGIALPKITPLEVVLTPRLAPELYQQLN